MVQNNPPSTPKKRAVLPQPGNNTAQKVNINNTAIIPVPAPKSNGVGQNGGQPQDLFQEGEAPMPSPLSHQEILAILLAWRKKVASLFNFATRLPEPGHPETDYSTKGLNKNALAASLSIAATEFFESKQAWLTRTPGVAGYITWLNEQIIKAYPATASPSGYVTTIAFSQIKQIIETTFDEQHIVEVNPLDDLNLDDLNLEPDGAPQWQLNLARLVTPVTCPDCGKAITSGELTSTGDFKCNQCGYYIYLLETLTKEENIASQITREEKGACPLLPECEPEEAQPQACPLCEADDLAEDEVLYCPIHPDIELTKEAGPDQNPAELYCPQCQGAEPPPPAAPVATGSQFPKCPDCNTLMALNEKEEATCPKCGKTISRRVLPPPMAECLACGREFPEERLIKLNDYLFCPYCPLQCPPCGEYLLSFADGVIQCPGCGKIYRNPPRLDVEATLKAMYQDVIVYKKTTPWQSWQRLDERELSTEEEDWPLTAHHLAQAGCDNKKYEDFEGTTSLYKLDQFIIALQQGWFSRWHITFAFIDNFEAKLVVTMPLPTLLNTLCHLPNQPYLHQPYLHHLQWRSSWKKDPDEIEATFVSGRFTITLKSKVED